MRYPRHIHLLILADAGWNYSYLTGHEPKTKTVNQVVIDNSEPIRENPVLEAKVKIEKVAQLMVLLDRQYARYS